MSGRTKLIIGNWKMHFTLKQALRFAERVVAKEVPEGVQVGITPHALALPGVAEAAKGTATAVVAQNAYFKDEGAFTGEISMPMLRGIAKYVLVGHSERRHVFLEANGVTREKVAAAMRSGIIPVLCVGETLAERQYHHTEQIINDQITLGLANLTAEEVARVVIAYEPVWAIGTGEFARPQDVEVVVRRIRHEIESLYGGTAAEKITILYGGSVNKDNAASYLLIDDVDGLLVGGASMSIATFWPIVEAAGRLTPKKIAVESKDM